MKVRRLRFALVHAQAFLDSARSARAMGSWRIFWAHWRTAAQYAREARRIVGS